MNEYIYERVKRMYKNTNKIVKGDGKRVNGKMKANLLSFLLVFVVLAVMLTAEACKPKTSEPNVPADTTESQTTPSDTTGSETTSPENTDDETTTFPDTSVDVTEHVCEEGTNYVTNGMLHWKECIYCGNVMGERADHTYENGSCTVCGYAHEEHTGGIATCNDKAVCTVCGIAYGETAPHTYSNGVCVSCNTEHTDHTGGKATCTEQAVCEVCGMHYGDKDPAVHSSAEFSYETVADKKYTSHTKKYACCGVVAAEDEKHTFNTAGTCRVCGFLCDHEGFWSGSRCSNCSSGCKEHTGGTATCTALAKCEKCGEEYGSYKPHVENTAWESDGNDHWKTCKNCNKEISGSRKAHNGGTATCTAKAKCKDCGSEYGNVLNHVPSSAYTTSDSEHWQVCKNCSAEISGTRKSHSGGTASCTSKAKCADCGKEYGTLLAHDENTSYAADANSHYKTCKSCNKEISGTRENHNGGTATCTAPAKCKDCGKSYGTLASHTESTAYTTDGNQHWKICANCSAVIGSKANHTYSNGKCTVCRYAHTSHTGGTATCTEQAVCSVCGIPYGNKNSSNHTGSAVYTPSTGSDKYKSHVKTYECCGASDSVKETHKFNSDGSGNCTVCSFSCDHEGYYSDGECSNCHSSCQHSGGTATCSKQATCEKCGKAYGEKLGHEYEYESKSNYHWQKCKNCTSTTAKTKCSGGTATCKDKAVCSTCKKEYGDTDNSAHVYGDWEGDQTSHYKVCSVCSNKGYAAAHGGGNATCTEQPVCSTCNKKYGSALGHTPSSEYKTSGSEHWQICKTCTAEISGTRENHAGSYKTSDSQHWKECEKCSAEISGTRADHSGGSATCTAQAKCSACNIAYGNKASHVASSTYSTDANQHWKKCANCTEIVEAKANHTYSNGKCTACQHEHTSHTYSNGKCTVCQYAHTNHSGAAYSCVEGTCTVCGATYGPTASHSYTVQKYNDSQHWRVCACGYEEDGSRGNHTYGDDKKCTECGSLRAYNKSLYVSIFQEPTSEFRWHSINHSLVNALYEKDSIYSDSNNWIKQGLGGFVTNIPYSGISGGNYLAAGTTPFTRLSTVVKKILGVSLDYNSSIADEKFNIWLYDELGYPSGGAGGKTVADNSEYQAKGLICITKSLNNSSGGVGITNIDGAIKIVSAYAVSNGAVTREGITVNENKVTYSGVSGKLYVFVLKNFHEGTHAQTNGYATGENTVKWSSPYYINIMDKSAVRAFIFNTYNQYRQYFKDGSDGYFDDVVGIFTDEPSLMEKYQNTSNTFDYAQLSWVDGFDTVFEDRHGYSILDNLHYVFDDTYKNDSDAKIVRVNYRQTVGDLVSENYFKQLSEYCRKYGTKLSGHGLLEEGIADHVLYYGDLMQSLREMDIPGVDSLWGNPESYLNNNVFMAVKYATSAATIAGKDRYTMVEFCADDFNHESAGALTSSEKTKAWKTLNLMYFQGITHINSYVDISYFGSDGRTFTDYFARLGYISRQAKWDGEIALYYPVNTQQAYSIPTKSAIINYAGNYGTINQVAEELYAKQLDFTIVDNQFILEATVENGVIYNEYVSFKAICMPAVEVMPYDVLQKLNAFEESGGTVVWIKTKPTLPDKKSDKTAFTTLINKMGAAVDVETGVNTVKTAVKDSKLSISYTASDLYVGKYALDNKAMYWLYNYSDSSRSITFSYTGSNGFDVYDPRTGEITSYSTSSINISIGASDAMIIIVK